MKNLLNNDMCIIFQPYIDDVERGILEILHSAKNDIDFPDTENIIRTIVNEYSKDALFITTRVQLLLKEENFNNNDIQYYNWASTDEARRVLQERFPEVVRLLEVKKKHIVALVKEVLFCFIKDLDKLKELDFPAGNRLREIIISAGDSHRGGKRVCFLETDKGKLVYKPRSVFIDYMAIQAASIINKGLSRDMTIIIPKVLDCGNYGWQEFVSRIPVTSKNELAMYYKSLGGLNAFFATFGGLDFHYENLTVVRNKAIPLDLETAFGEFRQARKIAGMTGITGIISQTLVLAGVDTLILPPLARNERFDIDLSPVTDGLPQESQTLKSSRISAPEAGGVEMVLENSIISKPAPFESYLELEECHPRSYVDKFHEGYKQVILAIFLYRDDLVDLLSNLSGIKNRCVIRPTSTYASFLNTSYHPNYLKSWENRKKLFGLLKFPPKVPKRIGKQALDLECESLMDGEYPYFTADILADFMSVVPNEVSQGENDSLEDFHVAPLEFLKNIDFMPLDTIRYLHYGAFAGIDSSVWATRDHGEIPPFFDLKVDNSWVGMLRSLAEQAQKLILLDTQNKVATMFMQSVGNDNRVQIVLLNSTYYEGQGVLWLLGYLKQLDGDKDCLDLLKPLLKNLLIPLLHTPQEPISGFAGGFSRIRLIPIVRKYLGKDAADDLLSDLVAHATQILDDFDGTDIKVDYVTGLAGALAALDSMEPFLNLNKEAYMLRDRMYTVVTSALMEGQLRDVTGVAHGPLGLMLGLAIGGGTLSTKNAQELRTQVRQRAMDELGDIRRDLLKIRQAWCTGVPGIAEAYACVLQATGGVEVRDRELLNGLFEECLSDIASLNGPVDMSLCHGVAGALSAWYRIDRYIPELQVANKIRDEVTRLRKRLVSGELDIRGGVRHATSSLGMMLGMSGVALAFSKIERGQDFIDFLSF